MAGATDHTLRRDRARAAVATARSDKQEGGVMIDDPCIAALAIAIGFALAGASIITIELLAGRRRSMKSN